MGPRLGMTFAKLAEEWRELVAGNLALGTVRAMESHLKVHLIPAFRDLRLTVQYKTGPGVCVVGRVEQQQNLSACFENVEFTPHQG
jgi:hypothetical protein